jgi:hypothetical protein
LTGMATGRELMEANRMCWAIRDVVDEATRQQVGADRASTGCCLLGLSPASCTRSASVHLELTRIE